MDINKLLSDPEKFGLMKRMPSLSEETVGDYIEVGEALIKARRYRDANSVLGVAAKAFPDNSHIQFCLGTVCIGLGRLSDAKKHYDKAIDGGYVTYRSLTSSAVLEETLGNNEKAEELLRRAREIETSSPIPNIVLYSHLFDKAEYQQAADVARELQTKYPDDYDFIHAEIASLTAADRAKQATERLGSVSRDFGHDKRYIYDYAFQLFTQGKVQEAWDYFQEKGDDLDHEEQMYDVVKARLSSALHMKEQAKEAYQDLYVRHGQVRAAFNLAVLLVMEGSHEEADHYLKKVIEAEEYNREYFAALYVHVKCLERMGSGMDAVCLACENAVTTYEKIINWSPLYGYVMEFAAECYHILGDTESEKRSKERFQHFKEVVEKEEEDEE